MPLPNWLRNYDWHTNPSSAVNANALTGTTLAAGVVTSSLTTLGTLLALAFGAGARTTKVVPTADATCSGDVYSSWVAGETITAGQLVFFKSDGKWWLVDADAEATCKGTLGIAMEGKNANQAIAVAMPGQFIFFTVYNFTVGAVLFASETPGGIAEAIPTGADGVVKPIGTAFSADVLWFNPTPHQSTTVA